MSFQWPLALLGLLALPALLGWLVVLRRRRRRYAVSFTNLDVLGELVGPGSRVRALLPPALFLLALATVLVGLGRPTIDRAIARTHATIVLAMDVSGSMDARDVAPTRLGAAQKAAHSFVRSLPSSFEVGLVAFASTANVELTPTRDREAFNRAVDRLSAGGGTAIGDALARALDATRPRDQRRGQPPRRATGGRSPRVVLLLSDGSNSEGVEPLAAAAQARAERVPVYTVALGTPDGTVDLGPGGSPLAVPPDPETLRSIARITGGRSFSTGDAGALRQIYSRIGERVGYSHQPREITDLVSALGALLLLSSIGLSALWSPRLP
jgi:Ca-activated chloride channel family protein